MLQAAEHLAFIRCSRKIVIGQDDAYMVSVGQVRHLPYHIVAGKELYIHQMDMPGTDGAFRQGAVSREGGGQMAALLMCAEGKEKRNVIQSSFQAGNNLVQGAWYHNGLKPVRPPFSHIHRQLREGGCLTNQGVIVPFHQRSA